MSMNACTRGFVVVLSILAIASGFGPPPCGQGEVEVFPSKCGKQDSKGTPAGNAKGSYCGTLCQTRHDCPNVTGVNHSCTMNQGDDNKYCEYKCNSDSDCPQNGYCEVNIKRNICTYPKPTPKTPFGNGVNLAASYFGTPKGNVSFGWDLMKQCPDIKTVRIEIEPNLVTVDQAKGWIKEAIDSGYDVIATCHNVKMLGSNDANELLKCGNWWATNYQDLSSNGPITVNLMNEWGNHDLSSQDYASAYNPALAAVRSSGYNGPVIIDAPGWGGESKKLADSLQAISDKNLILSMHVYPQQYNQGRDGYVQASDIDDISGAGLPCVLGEFGTNQVLGEFGGNTVDVPGVVKFAKARGCAVIGWAWNGDGGTMNMVTPAWKDQGGAQSFSKSGYFDGIYNLLGASSKTEKNVSDGRFMV